MAPAPARYLDFSKFGLHGGVAAFRSLGLGLMYLRESDYVPTTVDMWISGFSMVLLVRPAEVCRYTELSNSAAINHVLACTRSGNTEHSCCKLHHITNWQISWTRVSNCIVRYKNDIVQNMTEDT